MRGGRGGIVAQKPAPGRRVGGSDGIEMDRWLSLPALPPARFEFLPAGRGRC